MSQKYLFRFALSLAALNALGSAGYAQKSPPVPQACNCNANINSVVHVTCNGGSNGSANAILNAIGVDCTVGDPTYYDWFDSGGNLIGGNQSITGLTAGTYTCIMQNDDCYEIRTVTITQPAAITGSINKTNETCSQNNGTATVSGVAGGTGSYTYSWTFNGNPTSGSTASIGGLTQGNYACTVKDANNCSLVLSISVGNTGTDPNGSITLNNNVSCFGGGNGSATASATGGGGAPYTFAWLPSGGNAATANNLGPGTYTVNVTGSNGCVDPSPPTITITQPSSAINIGSTGMTPVQCNGGSNGQASVSSISGGTGAYTYSWSPSGGNAATAVGLAAGNYVCTVRDANNCSATAAVTVTQFSAVSGNATVNQHVSCFGGNNGSATVSSSGGNGSHTYSWSPSGGNAATANNLPAGTYACTVTDFNGCAVIVTNITINQPSSAVSANATSNPANCGTATGSASAGASGGTGSYTYQWSPSGGMGPTANNLFAGTYSVTVWDANGCSTTDVTIVGTTGSLSANASVISNVSCNGGTNGAASVTVSSGTPPYTYSWSPSGGASSAATGLSAGTKYVSVTDNAGCVTTKSVVITQPTAITGTVTSNPAACATSNGSATASVNGGTGAFTYSWTTAPVKTTQTVTGLTTGTYSVTVRDANNCSRVFSVTVGTIPSPLVSFSTTSVSCNGGGNGSASASPSGGGGPPYVYVWNTGQSTSAISNVPAGNYTVTVSTASCTNTATVAITQPAVLSAAMTTTPTPCLQSLGSARATMSGGTAPFTYFWTPGGQTTQTATGLAAGFYTVTVTDNNSCSKIFSTVVNNTNGPVVNAIPGDVTCFGGSDGLATVSVSGGTTPYTYAWFPSGGTSSSTTGLSAQAYFPTVTDAAGCVTTGSVVVGEPAQVLPNVSKDTVDGCQGQWALLGTSPSGGNPGYSWSWLPTGSLDDGTLPNPAAAPSVTTTYTVTVTDSKGCTGTALATVIVHNLPVINAGPAGITVCNGAPITLTATGGVSYSWSPATYLNSTTISNPVSTPASALTYTVIGTDSMGCSASDTVRIILANTPTVNVSASSSTVCGGTTLTLNAASNGSAYQWNTGQTTTSVSVAPTTTTNYSVTVSNGSCSKTGTVTVTALPAPNAVISGNPVHCIGTTQTLSVPAGNYLYAWNTGSTASSITISPTSNTTYSVMVTNASGNTCSDAATFSVTVAQLPVVTTSATYTTLCVGSATNTLTATGGTGYVWQPGGATTSAVPLSFNTVGIKSYTVTVTNSSGCSSIGTLTFNVTSGFPTPGVSPSSPLSFCVGDPLPTFTAVPNPSTNGIGWTFNSASASGLTYTPAQNLPAGTYSLHCVQGTGTSCLSNPTILTIVINPPPVAAAGNDVTVCPGFSTQLIGGGGNQYLWTPSAALNNAAVSNPMAEPELTTEYFVEVTDANNCKASDSVTVYVVLNDTCIIQVYNLISPNGDGDNDLWWIDGIKFFPDNKVQIFNRWGLKVWEGKNYDNDLVVWRGDNQVGGKLPESTYYYIIDLGSRTMNGFVELVH